MATIIVTGAEGGIGKSVVAQLKSDGHIIHALSHTDLDVCDPNAIARLRELGSPADWIICIHGFIDTETSLEKQSIDSIRKTFEVNTLSLFFLAREFLPLLPQGGGMIVISSSAGIAPNGRFAAYSAAKAAANAFVQALARNRPELSFFAIAPGPTNTAMRERVAHDAATKQSPAVITALISELVGGHKEYKSGDVILVKDGIRSIAARI
jgi:NAD(P)-dependent dehydrogenase (short-subunit alcohol dehydrogenase family)